MTHFFHSKYKIFISIFACSMAFISAAQALTKETAMGRCSAHIESLKNAPSSDLDAETKTFFDRITRHLELLLANLKKTEDVKEIYLSRQSCDNGFKAAQWIVDDFSMTQRKLETPEKIKNLPPPPSLKQTPPLKKDPHNEQSLSKDTKPIEPPQNTPKSTPKPT